MSGGGEGEGGSVRGLYEAQGLPPPFIRLDPPLQQPQGAFFWTLPLGAFIWFSFFVRYTSCFFLFYFCCVRCEGSQLPAIHNSNINNMFTELHFT